MNDETNHIGETNAPANDGSRRMVFVVAQTLGDLVGYIGLDEQPEIGQPILLRDAMRVSLKQVSATKAVPAFSPFAFTTKQTDVEVVVGVWYEITGQDRLDREREIKAALSEAAAGAAGVTIAHGSFPQHNGGRPAHMRR